MEFVVERDVPAGADRVWDVLADPVRWPQWTASVRRVELLDGGLSPGSRVRIVQPRMAPMTWTVTRYVEGRELTWVTRAPGVVTTGVHVVAPLAPGRSRLRIGVEQRGAGAGVAAALLGRRTRRYVTLEADGIEAAATGR